MNCAGCATLLDVDCYIDEEHSRPHESIDNGARCDNCLEQFCNECLVDGWCSDCIALEQKMAEFPSLRTRVTA